MRDELVCSRYFLAYYSIVVGTLSTTTSTTTSPTPTESWIHMLTSTLKQPKSKGANKRGKKDRGKSEGSARSSRFLLFLPLSSRPKEARAIGVGTVSYSRTSMCPLCNPPTFSFSCYNSHFSFRLSEGWLTCSETVEKGSS